MKKKYDIKLIPGDTSIVGALVVIVLVILALKARGDVPDQDARWRAAKIDPHYSIALDVSVALYKRNFARYVKITHLRENGVPAPILFCLHQRESSGNFRCHPHEGSPLTQRTRFVPKGRLPHVPPPYTFEQSAEDAYYVCDRLDLIDWRSRQDSLQGIEKFNGLGYQKYHPEVPSPYVWNGLLINGKRTIGKYTGDGKFSRMAVDGQLGVAAILMRYKEQGGFLRWDSDEMVRQIMYVPWKPPFDPRY
jgi:lysozyme family protein